MIILIDTQEKRPVLYDKLGSKNFQELTGIRWTYLKTGDYSIEGMDRPRYGHPSICIERKSLSDLFSSCGNERERLQREFERMSEFDYAELTIENDLWAIFKKPPPLSDMKPKAVYRTLIAWSQRYNVHIWPCPTRGFLEQHIFLTLKRFYDDRQEGGKQEFCKI